MGGTRMARQLLFAKEVTAGTEVHVATVKWLGTWDLVDKRETVFPEQDVGALLGSNRAYSPVLVGGLALADCPATYEQGPYLLAMILGGPTTGVADGGGGSGKIYAGTLPSSAWVTPQSYSMQSGDDHRVEFADYVFGTALRLKGKQKEAWTMGGDLVTRQVAPVTYTATTIAFVATAKHITDSGNLIGTKFAVGDKVVITGSGASPTNNKTVTVATVVGNGDITVSEDLTDEAATPSITLTRTFSVVADPSVEEIMFGNTLLYIDASGGSYGGTIKSGTLLEAECNTVGGWVPSFAGAGRLDYGSLRHAKPSADLSITFEHDGSCTTEKEAWRNHEVRKIRLINTGSSLVTAGSAYSKKSMVIDVTGMWANFPGLSDDDGNDTLVGKFRVTSGSITIVNSLATLT